MRLPGELVSRDSFKDAPSGRHFFAEFVEDGFSQGKHFRGSLAKIIGMTGFSWISFGAAEPMPPAKRLHRENALRQHGPITNPGVPRLRPFDFAQGFGAAAPQAFHESHHRPAPGLAVALRSGCLVPSHSLMPPPTGTTSPVIQAESSEARKTAALAMSSGWPVRPSGVRCTAYCANESCLVASFDCTPSVSVNPGESALTRIFRGPSSRASERLITSTAPLVPAYTEPAGAGVSEATELMLMMEPPAPLKFFAASCVTSSRPSTLRSKCLRKWASSISSSGRNS